jgi:hypothetical protein
MKASIVDSGAHCGLSVGHREEVAFQERQSIVPPPRKKQRLLANKLGCLSGEHKCPVCPLFRRRLAVQLSMRNEGPFQRAAAQHSATIQTSGTGRELRCGPRAPVQLHVSAPILRSTDLPVRSQSEPSCDVPGGLRGADKFVSAREFIGVRIIDDVISHGAAPVRDQRVRPAGSRSTPER